MWRLGRTFRGGEMSANASGWMSDGHAIDMVSDASAPGGMAFRATGAGTLTRSLPQARAFRVWADVRLGAPGAPIVLRIGAASLPPGGTASCGRARVG